MKLSIGFSPCPNDTFIFYALLHGKVSLPGITFEPVIADVEELNQKAYQAELDITKISFNAFLDLTESYVLLDSGSALGRNCGPLLISKHKMTANDLDGCRVAIPGRKTTANFLFDYYLSEKLQVDKQFVLFSDIESMLLEEKAAAGVIIHENRFTYQSKGLNLIQDLGSYWEQQTGHPIPLGGIIAKRSLSEDLLTQISDAIGQSIKYAWNHPDEVLDYAKKYAQEMEPAVMKQHIDLYVNDYSSDLGPNGKKAIKHFFAAARSQGRIGEQPTPPLFISAKDM